MKKLWRCGACGYLHEGDDAPDACPKCGAPKEKFSELSKEDAEKIYMSDRTNDIHMKLITLAGKIYELSKEGIELDLDPPCVDLFRKAAKASWVLKQSCKAELEGHMKRGKW